MTDLMESGSVTINVTGGQRFGPFLVNHGTYKHLLHLWEFRSFVTVDEGDGQEHSYKSRDVTAINWKPEQ